MLPEIFENAVEIYVGDDFYAMTERADPTLESRRIYLGAYKKQPTQARAWCRF